MRVWSRGQQTFFVKGQIGKYFRFCRSDGLCCNDSTPPLWESNHRQNVNKWAWLYPSETFIIKSDFSLQAGLGQWTIIC